MKPVHAMALAALLGAGSSPPSGASPLKLEAPALFEQSVTRHLRLSEDRAQVELEAGELFEDDGPAAGHSYRKPRNVEIVSNDTWIRKDLVIPRPQARAAFLVVLSEDPFEAAVNGIPQTLGENRSGRTLWKAYAVDPKAFKPGLNEILLRSSGLVPRAPAHSLEQFSPGESPAAP